MYVCMYVHMNGWMDRWMDGPRATPNSLNVKPSGFTMIGCVWGVGFSTCWGLVFRGLGLRVSGLG